MKPGEPIGLDQYSGFLLTYKQWIEIGVIVLSTFIATRVLKLVMNRFINRSSAILKIDRTRYNFFSNALNAVIYIFAVIFIIHTIPQLRSVSTTLFASAGILAAVIGFASQQAVSNIISGIFIIIFRPFRVGDNIKVGGTPAAELSGTVEDITLRHTVIKDAENARIIIPNSMINSQTVINYDIFDSEFRKRILFNISNESNVDLAIHLIKENLYKHPLTLHSKYTDASSIDVAVTTFTEKHVTLRAYVWTLNVENASLLSHEINRIMLDEFRKNNIRLSEPQTLVMQTNEK
ncbi:MAG TPA: mechanosensitive ion channel family protein [Flavobacteriales bacterium]|nr:mechanosensitive ion channel family protein [Flavobacteriales bacterium]